MQIKFAEHMGFCYGVKRAVDMTLKAGTGSYTLGDLIHNPQMIEELNKKDIKKVDSLYGLKEKSNVVFRAHGEPPISYKVAESRLLNIIDATCLYVKKVQDSASQLNKEGYTVAIIGDCKHPEVISIKAWAGNDAVVIGSIEDVNNFIKEDVRYGIVSQTTCTDELFDRLSKSIAEKSSDYKIIRTICNATADRQLSAIKLAKTVDTMIVIGGKNSANTNNLKKIIQQYCNKAFLVETKDELTVDMFKNSKYIGITAGASTPDWIIREVVNEIENFKETLNKEMFTEISKGEIIQGTVIKIDSDAVFLDIKYKTEGVIYKNELVLSEKEDISDIFKIGDTFDAYVLNPEKNDLVVLSKIKADEILAEDKLSKIKENDETVEATILSAVKGGVIANVLGVRGFIPASHLSLERISNLEDCVGNKVLTKIIELDLSTPRKRIVLSRRDILKEEQKAAEKAIYESIKENEVYEGKVLRLEKFGAFVDIHGVTGLLHISDIAWQRINHPSEVLNIGDDIKVLVKKVDVENKRISLSLRDLLEDPWIVAAKQFNEGSVVSGTVTRIAKFGVFVELAPNIDGLVHISEIAEERIENPESVVTVGDNVKVKVLKINEKDKRISLSIAAVKKDEEQKEIKAYLNNEDELKTSIGSQFDLSKLFNNKDE